MYKQSIVFADITRMYSVFPDYISFFLHVVSSEVGDIKLWQSYYPNQFAYVLRILMWNTFFITVIP